MSTAKVLDPPTSPVSPEDTLPTMYDLPSEDPEEPIEGVERTAYIHDFDVEIASYAAVADPVVMVTTPVAKGVWAVEPSDAPGLRIYVQASAVDPTLPGSLAIGNTECVVVAQ